MTRTTHDDAAEGIGLELAQRVLAAQPFSAMLGCRLVTFTPEEAVLELAVRPDLLQLDGFVHGGVLGYLADNAVTFAAGAAMGSAVVTSGLTIDYLRPAVGTRLRAVARCRHVGRVLSLVHCDVLDVDGEGVDERTRVAAVAQGRVAHRAQAG